MAHKLVIADAQNVGDALKELNLAMKECSDDVLRRPDIAGPRKAMLEVTFEPDPEVVDVQDSEYMPLINWSVKRALPPKKGNRIRGIVEDGKILINRREPDNPNQMTIDGCDEEEEPENVTKMKANG